MNRSLKIALINPPLSFSQVYGDWDLSAVDTYCPPLGLLYIAGYVRKYGHKPFIIDATAKKWTIDKTIDYIAALNPDIVGISARTVDIFSTNEISIKLKKNGVRAPIIIGGAHITAVPHETIERFESIDIGVIGEGELTFLEIIEKIWLKENLKDIKGIIFRDDTRKIIQTPARPLISDLDILPFPAWDLLDEFPHGYKHNALETKRLPAASIMTSRGCPFKCTFCDRAVFGSQVRHHSAEYTISMIKMLIKNYNIKDIMILDDNFILNKKKLFRVCDSIISENLDISWFCMGHAKVMDQTRLNKIKEAGCWIIELGIESGCDRILKLVQKNTTKAEIAQAVQRAHNAGLKVKGNFIFGLPGETKDSLEETINFAKDIPLSLMNISFFTVWPGCELAYSASDYGKVETDWAKLAHHRTTFIPRDLTENELITASKHAVRGFYMRPRIIFEMLSSMTNLYTIRSIIRGFIAFLNTLNRRISLPAAIKRIDNAT